MDNNNYREDADNKIAAFDQEFSSDHIRMLKIFLHYIPKAFRKNLTVYIKFLELQKTLYYSLEEFRQAAFKAASASNGEHSLHSEPSDFSSLIHELLPFCSPREKQQFQNMENMVNSFEQIKNMMEMMEMMKDMTGDGTGGFDPSMMAGMMGMNGFDFTSMFGSAPFPERD